MTLLVCDRFRQWHADGVSQREIGRRLGASLGAVQRASKAAGLEWKAHRSKATRKDDEALLGWIKRRCAGVSCGKIDPRRAGLVRTATRDVRNADLKESGEPASVVLGAYW